MFLCSPQQEKYLYGHRLLNDLHAAANANDIANTHLQNLRLKSTRDLEPHGPDDLAEQSATPQPNRHEVSNSEQNPGSRCQIVPSGGQEEPSAGDSLTPSRPSSADWGVAAFASCGLRIETFASVPRANRCRTHESPRHVRAITSLELEIFRLLWSSCSSAYQPTTSTPSTLKYFRCVPRT